MHAYCLCSTSSHAIESKIQSLLGEFHVSQFDTVIVERNEEKKDISISQIREMTKQLTLTPTNGNFTAAIIKNAHLMNHQAQNALLKTLEEPPPRAKLILATHTPGALLPTILSRCELYTLQDTETANPDSLITLDSLFHFHDNSVSQMLAETDTIAQTNQEARDFVDAALRVLYTALITEKTLSYGPKKCTRLAAILLETRAQLDANVNHKLALDCAFLTASGEARQG